MFRKACTDDIPQLIDLLGQLFSIEKDFITDAVRQRRGLLLLLESERAEIFVAEHDGRVVGMVAGQLLVSTSEGAFSLLVEDLVVDRGFRQRGYGTGLLESISAWGYERGADRMQLLADERNGSALEFYGRQGWRRTSMTCLRSYISNGVL